MTPTATSDLLDSSDIHFCTSNSKWSDMRSLSQALADSDTCEGLPRTTRGRLTATWAALAGRLPTERAAHPLFLLRNRRASPTRRVIPSESMCSSKA